jgi:hypothetical protein
MSWVDRVAHSLPDKVRSYRPASQVVPLERAAYPPRVSPVREGLRNIEMSAPRGEFESVVSPLANGRRERVQR